MTCPETLNLTNEFTNFTRRCEKKLLDERLIQPMIYSHGTTKDGMNRARQDNQEFLDSLKECKPNIYALWVRRDGDWELRYVGQRKCQNCHQRIPQHLFSCSERTGSKLANVQEALQNGMEIGVTTIKVTPDELRRAVEERIIATLKDKPTPNLWNQHG